MNFINYANYKNRVKYGLLNKFSYKNIYDIPKLEKINLSLNVNSSDLHMLVSSLIALELLTNQKGFLIRSKTFNLVSKIRKGDPVGSKVTLRKEQALKFILKLIRIRPKVKKFNGGHFSFLIKNLMVFKEIESNYHFFRKLNSLSIVVNTTCVSREELVFLIRCYNVKI
jgi:large subunit ribosomal protein L5